MSKENAEYEALHKQIASRVHCPNHRFIRFIRTMAGNDVFDKDSLIEITRRRRSLNWKKRKGHGKNRPKKYFSSRISYLKRMSDNDYKIIIHNL